MYHILNLATTTYTSGHRDFADNNCLLPVVSDSRNAAKLLETIIISYIFIVVHFFAQFHPIATIGTTSAATNTPRSQANAPDVPYVISIATISTITAAT